MNPRIVIPIVIAALSCTTFAADWETVARTPAQIEVVDMHPAPLVESKDPEGWAKVPAAFIKNSAVAYLPKVAKMGVADITVTGDGYLLVACNYDYQGNREGKWYGEVWDEAKFKVKGWHVVSKHELDGELLKGNNRLQVVFSKQVHKGEKLRLRCNKYDPPFPILLGAKAEGANRL